MLKQVLIITNPVAGKGMASHYSQELRKVINEHHSAHCHIRETTGSGDAFKWAERAVQDGYDSVFCLGGDGTVSEVINGLMQHDERPNFGFVPLGTVNDLARSIGYARTPTKAIQEFASVEIGRLDVGQVNETYFANVIALGNIAQDVMNTQAEDKNRFGVLAYIADGVGAFFSNEAFQLRVSSNRGIEREISTNLLLVGLTNSVGSVEFAFADASYNDNLLHFAAVLGNTPLHTVEAAIEHRAHQFDVKLLDNRRFWTFEAEEITIESLDTQAKQVVSNLDGDPGPTTPLEIRVIPDALPLITPKRPTNRWMDLIPRLENKANGHHP